MKLRVHKGIENTSKVFRVILLLFAISFLSSSIWPEYILDTQAEIIEQLEKGEEEKEKEESKEETEKDDYAYGFNRLANATNSKTLALQRQIQAWQADYTDIPEPPPEQV